MGGNGLELAQESAEKCGLEDERSVFVATEGIPGPNMADCDPGLAEIVSVWPNLPVELRTSILAMVQSTR